MCALHSENVLVLPRVSASMSMPRLYAHVSLDFLGPCYPETQHPAQAERHLSILAKLLAHSGSSLLNAATSLQALGQN